jgi:hypothetical protein
MGGLPEAVILSPLAISRWIDIFSALPRLAANAL